MKTKRTQPGTPKTFVIEVGPIISYGFGRSDVARMERETKRDIDTMVRRYMLVGPYSKVVRSRVEEHS